MKRAQVLVYEADGRLAELLREPAEKNAWWLRELRQVGSVLEVLGPGVLVLKLGRDLERELALLENVTWQSPETATVVVGDTDSPALADLAWDLGARCVLFPPLRREQLEEIVTGLLQGNTAADS